MTTESHGSAKDGLMAELIEVHTTVQGPERAVELASEILHAGLAASIDISEVTGTVPRESEETAAWQLTAVTTATRFAALQKCIEQCRHGEEMPPVLAFPITGDIESHLDRLHDKT